MAADPGLPWAPNPTPAPPTLTDADARTLFAGLKARPFAEDDPEQRYAGLLLSNYAKAKAAAGEPVFGAAPPAADPVQVRQRFAGIYAGGPSKADLAIPEGQRDRFRDLLKLSADPDETAAGAVNQAYVRALRPDLPPEAFGSNWPQTRAQIARELGDEASGSTDKGLFQTLAQGFAKAKGQETLLTSLAQNMAKAALDPKQSLDWASGTWVDAYKQALPGIQADPAFDPAQRDHYRRVAQAAYESAARIQESLQPVAHRVLGLLQSIPAEGDLPPQGKGAFGAGAPDPAEEALQSIKSVPADERPLLYGMLAAQGQEKGQAEGQARGLGENLNVTVNRMLEGLYQDNRAVFDNGALAAAQAYAGAADKVRVAGEPQDGESMLHFVERASPGARGVVDFAKDLFSGGTPAFRELTADEQEKLKSEVQDLSDNADIARNLDNIRRGVVAPVVGGNWLTRKILYPAVQQAGLVGESLIPYAGLPLLINSTMGQAVQHYRDQGLPADEAQHLGFVAGAIQAPLVFLSGKLVAGRIPALRALTTLSTEGTAAELAQQVSAGQFAKRGLTLFALEAGVLNSTAAAQELTPAVVQWTASKLSAAYPKVDWAKELAGFGQRRLDTFWAMLPMALVGTGTAAFSDQAFGRRYLGSLTLLKAAGFDEAQARDLMTAPTAEDQEQILRELWQETERNNELQQAGFDELDQDLQHSFREGTGELGASAALAPEGHWDVRDENGELFDQASDQDSALELVRDYDRARRIGMSGAVADAVDFVTRAQEPGSRVELTGETVTMADRIKAGAITPEEAAHALRVSQALRGLEGAPAEDPASVRVLGENQVRRDAATGLYQDISKIHEGANPLVVIEEHAEGYIKRRLAEGQVSADELGRWRTAVDGPGGDRSDRGMTEWFSHMAKAYFTGHADLGPVPTSVRLWLAKAGEFFQAVFQMAGKLLSLEKAGQLPGGFQQHLARATGLDEGWMQSLARNEERANAQPAGEEFGNWIRKKLPRPDTAAARGDPLAGELRDLFESMVEQQTVNPKQTAGRRAKGQLPPKPFTRRSDAKARAFFAGAADYTGLDRLAEKAREAGFRDILTPNDLLDHVQRALRGERILAQPVEEGQFEPKATFSTQGEFPFPEPDEREREAARAYSERAEVPGPQRAGAALDVAQMLATARQPDLASYSGKEGTPAEQAAALREPGAPEKIAAGYGGGRRISSIFPELAEDLTRHWDIRGLVIAAPRDLAVLSQMVRSPYAEMMKAALLDEENRVVRSEILSVGSVTSALADPRMIGRMLSRITDGVEATRLVLAHNHPSGVPEPSAADLQVTRQFHALAAAAGLDLVDHVITNGESHYSFRDAGLLGFSGAWPSGAPAQAHGELGRLAPWEKLPRSELTRLGTPEVFRSILRSLRQVSPEALHIAYANVKNALVGLERFIPGEMSSGELRRRILTGAGREGATALFAVLPESLGAMEGRQMLRSLQNLAEHANLRLLDATEPGRPDGTARAAGLIGEGEDATYNLGLRDAVDELNRVFAPQARGGGARVAAGMLREMGAELAQRSDRAGAYLQGAREHLDGLSREARWEFVDRIERGDLEGVDPKLAGIAAAFRRILDFKRGEVQKLGTGELEHFVVDYFPHIWKDPANARVVMAKLMQKPPIEGSKAFLKERTIPTIKEGMAAALEPISDNPVDLVLAKAHEMDKFILAQRWFDQAQKLGLGEWVKAGNPAPVNFRKVDDRIAVRYGPRYGAVGLPAEANVEPSEVRVYGRRIMAEFYAPDEVAQVVNNYLSPGLRGSKLFRGYLSVANAMNQAQLGLSAFHLGFTTLDTAVSRLAMGLERIVSGDIGGLRDVASAAHPLSPLTVGFQTALRGDRMFREWMKPGSQGADVARMVDAVKAGGGRAQMDVFFRNVVARRMVEAFRRGNYLGGLARVIPAGLEVAAKPVMEWLVPRYKLGVFAELARREFAGLEPGAPRTEVQAAMARAWDSVDNRLGQMVYDNLFWNRAVKDLAMSSVRSLGWDLGTLRELGGGAADLLATARALASGRAHDAAFTHRMGYLVAMPTLTALMGATAQYLMTGQGPQELRDYFFPRTGELDPQGRAIRLTLPSYMKDVAHYAHDPVGTITGKVHPLPAAVWDMLSNRNFYGGAIRNADDPLIKQLRDTVVHLAESAEPIAVENILKSRSAQVAPWESAANYFGISKAPQWLSMSPAEQLAEDLVHNKLGPGYAPDNPQASDERQALLGQLRQGTQESRQAALGKIRELLRTGQMTRRQASALALESRNVYLVNQVRHLDAREAIRVYRISSPQEKATIHSLVGAKIVRSALPPADKVLLLHELESLNPKE